MMFGISLFEEPHRKSGGPLQKEYDSSKAKRRAVLSAKGKTRITILLDDAVVARFKALSDRTGRG